MNVPKVICGIEAKAICEFDRYCTQDKNVCFGCVFTIALKV